MFFKNIYKNWVVLIIILSLGFSLNRAAAISLEAQETVKIQGFAVSLPGQFGQQFFYLYHNQELVQIYNYWKRFPDFNLNDYLEIVATFSDQTQWTRFKTKESQDIKIIKSNPVGPRINLIDKPIQDYFSEQKAFLGRIKGVIKKINPTNLELTYRQGSLKVDLKLLPKTGIANWQINDELEVSGIITKSESNPIITPRIPSDIKVYKAKIENTTKTEITGSSTLNKSLTSNSSAIVKPTALKGLGLILTCWLIFIIIRKN